MNTKDRWLDIAQEWDEFHAAEIRRAPPAAVVYTDAGVKHQLGGYI